VNFAVPEPTTLDNSMLLRRTLVTVGAMVGACVFIVGTLTLVATAIVGHAVGSRDGADGGGAATSNATVTGPTAPGAKPVGGGTPAQRR
jgi:hypothetical protein